MTQKDRSNSSIAVFWYITHDEELMNRMKFTKVKALASKLEEIWKGWQEIWWYISGGWQHPCAAARDNLWPVSWHRDISDKYLQLLTSPDTVLFPVPVQTSARGRGPHRGRGQVLAVQGFEKSNNQTLLHIISLWKESMDGIVWSRAVHCHWRRSRS